MKYSRLLILSLTLGCILLFTSCSEIQSLSDIDIPLNGESVMADINGDPYRFFRYDTVEAADADVAGISEDGTTIRGKNMPWDGPVHIFKLSKRIVIYVGDTPETLATIQNVFGPQVAGEKEN